MFKEHQGTFPGYKRQADTKVKKSSFFFHFAQKTREWLFSLFLLLLLLLSTHKKTGNGFCLFVFSFSPKSENTSPVPFIPRKQTGQEGVFKSENQILST